MAYELVYTSTPAGLAPNTSGFCVVACTNGLGRRLIVTLESLSAYRPIYPHYAPNAWENPIARAHYLYETNDVQQHILSRVCFNGVDYTQRSNKLASFLVLSEEECQRAAGGPTSILSQEALFKDEHWAITSEQYAQQKEILETTTQPGKCPAWNAIMGDAGWAGYLAQSYLENPTRVVYILYAPEQNKQLVALLQEALNLLPADKRWEVSFNTYFVSLPLGVRCQWRCCLATDENLQNAYKSSQNICINLTQPQPLPDLISDPLIEIARHGLPEPKPIPEPIPEVIPEPIAKTLPEPTTDISDGLRDELRDRSGVTKSNATPTASNTDDSAKPGTSTLADRLQKTQPPTPVQPRINGTNPSAMRPNGGHRDSNRILNTPKINKPKRKTPSTPTWVKGVVCGLACACVLVISLMGFNYYNHSKNDYYIPCKSDVAEVTKFLKRIDGTTNLDNYIRDISNLPKNIKAIKQEIETNKPAACNLLNNDFEQLKANLDKTIQTATQKINDLKIPNYLTNTSKQITYPEISKNDKKWETYGKTHVQFKAKVEYITKLNDKLNFYTGKKILELSDQLTKLDPVQIESNKYSETEEKVKPVKKLADSLLEDAEELEKANTLSDLYSTYKKKYEQNKEDIACITDQTCKPCEPKKLKNDILTIVETTAKDKSKDIKDNCKTIDSSNLSTISASIIAYNSYCNQIKQFYDGNINLPSPPIEAFTTACKKQLDSLKKRDKNNTNSLSEALTKYQDFYKSVLDVIGKFDEPTISKFKEDINKDPYTLESVKKSLSSQEKEILEKKATKLMKSETDSNNDLEDYKTRYYNLKAFAENAVQGLKSPKVIEEHFKKRAQRVITPQIRDDLVTLARNAWDVNKIDNPKIPMNISEQLIKIEEYDANGNKSNETVKFEKNVLNGELDFERKENHHYLICINAEKTIEIPLYFKLGTSKLQGMATGNRTKDKNSFKYTISDFKSTLPQNYYTSKNQPYTPKFKLKFETLKDSNKFETKDITLPLSDDTYTFDTCYDTATLVLEYEGKRYPQYQIVIKQPSTNGAK